MDSLRADTLFATPQSESHSITAMLTAQGRTVGYTETFVAVRPTITAQLDFFYGALNDGGVITGTVTLSNGKTVPIVAGRALITPKDSLREGTDSITVTGRMQSQRRWVSFVDNRRYSLEVTGPDIAQYESILGLGHRYTTDSLESRTFKWTEQPTFIIDDAGHIDKSSGWVRKTGAESPASSRLQADDVADIIYFMTNVFSIGVNDVFVSRYEFASQNPTNANRFQGNSADLFPHGFVYNGACTPPTLNWAITHSYRVIPPPMGHTLAWASNCMKFGGGIARSGWLSDLIESLGYNTNVSTAPIIDAQAGTVKPFFAEVAKYFYSTQRPAGSGRWKGVADYINNKTVPDSSVGPLSGTNR